MFNLLTEYNATGGGADSGCQWLFLGRRVIDSTDPLVGGISISVDGVTTTYNINDTIGSSDDPLVDFIEVGFEYELEYLCDCGGDSAVVVFQLEDCCLQNDPGIDFLFDGSCLEILPVGMVDSVTSDLIEWRKPGGTYQPYTGLLCGCDIGETFDVTPTCAIFSGGIYIGYNSVSHQCVGRSISQVFMLFGDGTNSYHVGGGLNIALNSSAFTPAQWVNDLGRTIDFKIYTPTPIGTLIKKVKFTYTGTAGATPSCANIQITEQDASILFYDIEAQRTVTYGSCPQSIVADLWDSPSDCLLDVTLVLANGGGGTSLIASVVENCTGARTNVWYKDGSPITGETDVNVNRVTYGFGTYLLVVTCGGCTQTGSLVYQDSCSVSVFISQSGTTLTANDSGCSGTANYSWQFFDGTTVTDLPDITQNITANESGKYIVTILCGACSATDDIDFVMDCSGFSVAIINNDPTFNSSLTGCVGTPSYNWEFFTGGVWMFRGSASSYIPTETGSYRLTAVCDGCEDIDFEDYTVGTCDGSVTIDGSGCDLFISTIDLITSPSNQWQIDSGVWTDAGGSGVTFTGQHGERYRLRVIDLADNCTYFSNVIIGDCQVVNCNCNLSLTFDSPNCRLNVSVSGTTCGSWFLQFSTSGTGGWISKLTGTGPVSTIYNVAENGFYRLEVVGTGLCPNQNTTPIEIDCLADPCDIFNANILGDNLICVDNSVTLTANPQNGSGAYDYLWSNGGGTGSTANYSESTIGTITYSLTITDRINGCVDTDTHNVTYETCADPCASFLVGIIGVTNACGSSVGLLATSSGGAGNPTYLWSTGQTTRGITVGSGTYMVTVTDGPCSETHDITVTVQAPLNVNAGLNQTVDCDEIININVTVSGGLDPGGNWSSNGGGAFESGTASHSNVYFPTPAEIGTTVVLTYTVVAFGNCPAVSDSVNITIRPCCTLGVAITGSTTVCGSLAVLGTNVTGANGPVSWLWSNGATTASINLFSAVSSMNISVVVTDLICDATDAKTITFSPVNFADAGTNKSVCIGQNVQLSANFPPSPAVGTWSGAGLLSDIHDPNATFTPLSIQEGTTVTLTWTVSGGICPDSTDTVNITVFGDDSSLNLVCTPQIVDYFFLVDTSGSISTAEFDDMRDSIRATIDQLELNSQNKRYSILQYGTDANSATNNLQITVNSTSSATVAKNFNRADIGGGDHLFPTIQLIMDRIDSSALTVRSGAARKLILFTDALEFSYPGPTGASSIRPYTNMNELKRDYNFQVSVRFFEQSPGSRAQMAANASVGGPYTGTVEPNPGDPEGSGVTPRRLYVRIDFTGGVVPGLEDDLDDCLLSVINAPTGSTYLWNTGETTSSINVGQNDGLTYTVQISTPNGCVFNNQFVN